MGPPKKVQSLYARAETILEVLVAVGILSIMLVLAGQLRVTAIRQSAEARHALIARNLADEGVEAIRAIVGQNRLRYAARVQDCWNTMPSPPQSIPTLAQCHEIKIRADSYVLSRDLGTLSWRISSTAAPLPQLPVTPYPAGTACENQLAAGTPQQDAMIEKPTEPGCGCNIAATQLSGQPIFTGSFESLALATAMGIRAVMQWKRRQRVRRF